MCITVGHKNQNLKRKTLRNLMQGGKAAGPVMPGRPSLSSNGRALFQKVQNFHSPWTMDIGKEPSSDFDND